MKSLARRTGSPFRAAALLALCAACATGPGAPEWLVDRPRLLAVQAEPPEVQPGARASFRVLAAGPAGELDGSAATWGLCTAPLPLTETGAVATACLGALATAAQGEAAPVATSSDACSRFGPVASPGVQRAREPDATGGYYQPVRVALGGGLGFSFERLLCPLAQASFAVAQEYAARYPPNRNPAIADFAASLPLEAVPAGAAVELALSWDAASVETYPVLDAASLQLVDERETLAVSWFATAGVLASARSGESAPGADAARTIWTAPASPGVVYLWAVLRDSRGGLAWASARATVVAEGR